MPGQRPAHPPGAVTAGEATVVAGFLKAVAILEATGGVLAGIVIGFAAGDTTGSGGGFHSIGVVVIVAALVNALLFWALAVGLACLDQIRRNTARAALD
jgi:hypothetical protein